MLALGNVRSLHIYCFCNNYQRYPLKQAVNIMNIVNNKRFGHVGTALGNVNSLHLLLVLSTPLIKTSLFWLAMLALGNAQSLRLLLLPLTLFIKTSYFALVTREGKCRLGCMGYIMSVHKIVLHSV